MVENKKAQYTIEFFKLYFLDGSSEYGSYSDIFNSFITEVSPVHKYANKNYSNDIYGLYYNNKDGYFAGQFRKLRQSNIPEKGKLGLPGQELELEEDEGLIESNFFLFYPQRDILVWCVDRHGSTHHQLLRFIKTMTDVKISLNPILKTDSLKKLMDPKNNLVKIGVTLPRSSPETFLEDPSDFSGTTMKLLSDFHGDQMKIEISINSNLADSKGSLIGKLRESVKYLSGNGASKVKATVLEEGSELVLDLISDRMKTSIEVETNKKYPPARTMHKEMHKAVLDHKDELDKYDDTDN